MRNKKTRDSEKQTMRNRHTETVLQTDKQTEKTMRKRQEGVAGR